MNVTPPIKALYQQARAIDEIAAEKAPQLKTSREAFVLSEEIGVLRDQIRAVETAYKALLWADAQPDEEDDGG